MNNSTVWYLFFPKGCIGGVCSHLSPAAISPLRARARFAGSVLIRFDSLHAVVGSVSILVLTHDNTPLGPTSTGTGTLNTADIGQQVNPRLSSASRTRRQLAEGSETNVAETTLKSSTMDRT